MTEINTFSAAVDDVMIRASRPGRKADIVSYVRQTMRECQLVKGALFARDMVEDQITVTAAPFTWTRPANLRMLRTARYSASVSGYEPIYPKLVLPGKRQQDETYFYYVGPTYFVFSGLSTNDVLDVAYYTYLVKLAHYTAALRPAVYSLETATWTYLAAYDVNDITRQGARDLVTNWLLTDWYDLIIEGALAKILKTVGDERARSSFALYKSLQADLYTGESQASLGY